MVGFSVVIAFQNKILYKRETFFGLKVIKFYSQELVIVGVFNQLLFVFKNKIIDMPSLKGMFNVMFSGLKNLNLWLLFQIKYRRVFHKT